MGSDGKVWIVGAGPGDPGLITVKGRQALRKADVVLFDRLVNPAILLWARKDAELLDVGKMPGGQRTEQKIICRYLFQKAKKGFRVVRLKGGDPFVFGRGGEEAIYLAQKDIPFEVVPGVTAGVAVPAATGIPVTHRGISTEVAFRIGAKAKGSVEGKTLVGYMSVEGLKAFLQEALAGGFTRTSPVALIHKGTLPGQEMFFSTVGNLLKDTKGLRMKPPAIVVVGNVVSLRHRIGRQSKGRLSGRRVILTVSSELARGWREVFEEEGAEVWDMPMTQIHEIPMSKDWEKDLRKSDWIALTSGAGARALIHAVADIRKLAAKKIAVIGPSTAQICRQHGLGVDFIGRGLGAISLAKNWPGKKEEGVLHCTGSAEEGLLRNSLARRGFLVKRSVMYRNTAPPNPPRVVLDQLRKEGADWVVFASGTAAKRFQRLMGRPWASQIKVAAIGDSTARTCRQAGWRVVARAKDVSARAVLSAMLKFE